MSALRSGMLWLAPVFATGCNGVFWGNLGVLCVTVAIFLGTVFLTRSSGNRSASRSLGSRADARTSVLSSRADAPASVLSSRADARASTASTSHHS